MDADWQVAACPTKDLRHGFTQIYTVIAIAARQSGEAVPSPFDSAQGKLRRGIYIIPYSPRRKA